MLCAYHSWHGQCSKKTVVVYKTSPSLQLCFLLPSLVIIGENWSRSFTGQMPHLSSNQQYLKHWMDLEALVPTWDLPFLIWWLTAERKDFHILYVSFLSLVPRERESSSNYPVLQSVQPCCEDFYTYKSAVFFLLLFITPIGSHSNTGTRNQCTDSLPVVVFKVPLKQKPTKRPVCNRTAVCGRRWRDGREMDGYGSFTTAVCQSLGLHTNCRQKTQCSLVEQMQSSSMLPPHLRFNGFFPNEPQLARFPLSFFVHCFSAASSDEKIG